MRNTVFLTLALGASMLAPSVAAAADTPAYVPGQVIVKYRDGTTAPVQTSIERTAGADAEQALPGGSRRLDIEDGESVRRTVDELERDPNVAYAVPNYLAHAAFQANDPGFKLQWNFWGPFGIDLPAAWDLARLAGAPGGRGAVVAVLDTGVAYRDYKHRYRRAPDLRRFIRGYDFVDNDTHPFDLNGHGTHVAGTIAQTTNNSEGATGVAYRARIMPLRVLDAEGAGDTVSIARAIRFAAKRRVDVINLSLEFDSSVRASQIPDIVRALRYARRRGVLVVAAAGNQADSIVAYPARVAGVIAVSATTETGCLADYSNTGRDVDITAPGGGQNAPIEEVSDYDRKQCVQSARRDIYQQTFTTSLRRFGLPTGYEGTSMAAPHVAGLAALIIGTRRLGSHPSPRAVEQRIKQTARDIGPVGPDSLYGAGLIDAAAALRP